MRTPLGRVGRTTGGTAAGVGACVAVGLGWVDGAQLGSPLGPTLPSTALFASLVILVVWVVSHRLQYQAPSARLQRVSRLLSVAPVFADLEVALALCAGLYAALAVTGGLDSPGYPLVYGLVAFSATFQRRQAALVTIAAVVALEAAAVLRSGEQAALFAGATHGAFVCGAALLHALFLRGLVAHYRRDHDRRVREDLARRRQSAADYRLISVSLGADSRVPRTRAEEEEMLALGSAATIGSATYLTLSMLQRTLCARTCLLVWFDERGSVLRIKEMVSDSDNVREGPTLPVAGVLGAVIRDGSPLCLTNVRPGQVPYYQHKMPIGAFVGVPVKDGAHLRGLICVDRDQPFDEGDVALVTSAAEQVLAAVRSERTFSVIERAKYEHERFYQASSLLCRALTLEQVMETAFDAAAAIAAFDVAVVTLYDQETRRHRVYSTRFSEQGTSLVSEEAVTGLQFKDNAGLASMVVKNRHHLPASGALRDEMTPVFTRRVRIRGAESLVVLPLLSADEAIGTFTLASRERGQYRKDIREMLGVIANQVAISIQNALMYKKMETMATTDGLTGLTNHRTFQDRFANLLDRAERHGHQAAILLCDIDHFKSVNDTYGHPIGDEVLRRVARVLLDAVRKIDIPARYGGEEFAVVLEATDLEGAVRIAERIRTDVGKLVIESDKGPFQVTMSIGLATFPEDARDQAALIERADLALYHAKETGRNRVISHQAFLAARNSRRAS